VLAKHGLVASVAVLTPAIARRVWKMRKCLWIIPVLLLFAAICAPNALADTLFTYTYTYTPVAGSTFSFTTVPLDPALLGTFQGVTTITAETLTGNYSANVLVGYVLDGSNPGAPGANLLTQTTGGIAPPEDFFSPSDYTTAGTYNGNCADNCFTGPITDTLTVTLVQTPEPSTYGLMLLGVGFLLVMRRRFA
jgi:hypothetical protein